MPDNEKVFNDVLQCFFTGSEEEPEMNLLFASDNFSVKGKGLFTEKSRIVSATHQATKEAE